MNQKTTNTSVAFVMVTALFFLWALAHNLNPVLIPHLKKAFHLTDMKSALIDSSFFIAYFIMAIPAGMLMKKFGYKTGIITGLILFACGAFLFYPAATILSFEVFLFALFVIASGLTFLETAANPYITILGPSDKATLRLNFAQSFNGLGATIAPLIGGKFILSGVALSDAQKQNMSADALQQFYATEAAAVRIPYLLIGLLVLTVAVVFIFIHLPDVVEENAEDATLKNVLKNKQLVSGVVAQFFYVGAQVGIGSFFIRFLGREAMIDEKTAAYYLSVALLLFMTGRFAGTFIMRFIDAHKLLTIYSIINIVLLLFAVSVGKMVSVYALMSVEFFMSIMFPTIFSVSIESLKAGKKLGSSLVIMSIVGGAVIPLVMGKVSDMSSIRFAYLVPMCCFFVVAYFGIKSGRQKAF